MINQMSEVLRGKAKITSSQPDILKRSGDIITYNTTELMGQEPVLQVADACERTATDNPDLAIMCQWSFDKTKKLEGGDT